MSKSVFQQLVEQTCRQANSFTQNEKPANSNQKPPSPDPKLAALETANATPRCQHVKANGVRCKSPAMRKLDFCFFHEKFYNPPYDDSFPPLEDANSVQCAILQVLNGLKTKVITLAEARVMLYGLKAASINARSTNFEPRFVPQVIEYPNPNARRPAEKPKPSDNASALQEFHQAVKDQASTVQAAKPPSSAKIVDVVVNNGSGAAH